METFAEDNSYPDLHPASYALSGQFHDLWDFVPEVILKACASFRKQIELQYDRNGGHIQSKKY